MTNVLRSIAAIALSAAMGVAVATTGAAPAAAAHHRPSLRPLKAKVQLDKNRYKPRAKAHLTIVLKNNGGKKLRGITAACNRIGNPNGIDSTGRAWKALAASGKGVTIKAHHSRTFHITVRVPAAAKRAGYVFAGCDFGYRSDDTGYRPHADDQARVPGNYGTVVTAFHSTSTGKQAGLEGVSVTLVDTTDCRHHRWRATSNAAGTITIRHVPAGYWYKLYFALPRGWTTRHNRPFALQVFGGKGSGGRSNVVVARGKTAPAQKLPAKCR